MENEYSNLFEFFEKLGKRYVKEHLGRYDKKELQTNWQKALYFFFSKSFMRGRLDELSDRYLNFTIAVLNDRYFINNNLEDAYKKMCNERSLFDVKCELKKIRKLKRKNRRIEKLRKNNPIYDLFLTKRNINGKKTHLGNIEDIMMVFDVLKFITHKDKNKNIFNYILKKIKNNKTESVYNELKDKKFRSISHKLASFIIRDIYLINNDYKIKINSKYAFPVDTWVRKVADKLYEKKFKNDRERIDYLIKHCGKNNPMLVAAGIWYFSTNSFTLLLEEKINN